MNCPICHATDVYEGGSCTHVDRAKGPDFECSCGATICPHSGIAYDECGTVRKFDVKKWRLQPGCSPKRPK